ncbi:hypothetical protein PSEUDO9AG_70235 [Pseudomonas sp. 9Ag]|nr:hypothetical protein PSEUDO9AG_70235 [Pseudomonas sp. 9Ag]
MYAVDPHDSLVPIFVEHLSSGKVEQVGTGIFIEFQGAPFLFTAAHVTDITEYGSLMAPTANGISAIDGYMAYVDLLPESNRSEDTVDIAYFRLTQPSLEAYLLISSLYISQDAKSSITQLS